MIDDLAADSSKTWTVAELSTKYNANPSVIGESRIAAGLRHVLIPIARSCGTSLSSVSIRHRDGERLIPSQSSDDSLSDTGRQEQHLFLVRIVATTRFQMTDARQQSVRQ